MLNSCEDLLVGDVFWSVVVDYVNDNGDSINFISGPKFKPRGKSVIYNFIDSSFVNVSV
jgi:hypothetical protein